MKYSFKDGTTESSLYDTEAEREAALNAVVDDAVGTRFKRLEYPDPVETPVDVEVVAP